MAFRKLKAARQLTADEILVRMEHYCVYRERCPKEVNEKLKELGASGEIAAQIFQVLKADRFFDEERFAHAFVSGKYQFNHWGRLRIRRELMFRNIDPEVLEAALATIEEEAYQDLIRKLLLKKLREYSNDAKAREKSAASLIRSGFEPDLIFKNLKLISLDFSDSES